MDGQREAKACTIDDPVYDFDDEAVDLAPPVARLTKPRGLLEETVADSSKPSSEIDDSTGDFGLLPGDFAVSSGEFVNAFFQLSKAFCKLEILAVDVAGSVCQLVG